MPLGVGSAMGAGAEPRPSAKLVLPSGLSRVQGNRIRSTCCSQRPALGQVFFLRPPFPFLRALTSETWREQKAFTG